MALISSYADDAATTDTDRFLTYASDGTTKLTPASNLPKYLGDGWITTADTWTYSSYNTATRIGVINASSGANVKYGVGMWLKFTQPTLGVKYAVVLSATTTTITLKFTGGTILSNEAISLPFFSATASPFGTSKIQPEQINFGDGVGNGIWFEEIGRTTLTSASNTISLSSLPARRYLQVRWLLIPNASSINPFVQYNGDTAANYASRLSQNGGADTTPGVQVANYLDVSGAQNLLMWGKMEILNVTGQDKISIGVSTTNGAAGPGISPTRREFAQKWVGSAQITSILVDAGASMAAGSQIIVLGHD